MLSLPSQYVVSADRIKTLLNHLVAHFDHFGNKLLDTANIVTYLFMKGQCDTRDVRVLW